MSGMVDRHTIYAIYNEAIVCLRESEQSKDSLSVSFAKLDKMESIIRKGEELARFDKEFYAEELQMFRNLREEQQKMAERIRQSHNVDYPKNKR